MVAIKFWRAADAQLNQTHLVRTSRRGIAARRGSRTLDCRLRRRNRESRKFCIATCESDIAAATSCPSSDAIAWLRFDPTRHCLEHRRAKKSIRRPSSRWGSGYEAGRARCPPRRLGFADARDNNMQTARTHTFAGATRCTWLITASSFISAEFGERGFRGRLRGLGSDDDIRAESAKLLGQLVFDAEIQIQQA